jgi:hypothetical protein
MGGLCGKKMVLKVRARIRFRLMEANTIAKDGENPSALHFANAN